MIINNLPEANRINLESNQSVHYDIDAMSIDIVNRTARDIIASIGRSADHSLYLQVESPSQHLYAIDEDTRFEVTPQEPAIVQSAIAAIPGFLRGTVQLLFQQIWPAKIVAIPQNIF